MSAESRIFAGLVCRIHPSLEVERNLLCVNGASESMSESDAVTHIVSNSVPDFQQYQRDQAREKRTAFVSGDWVMLSLKCRKQLNPAWFNPVKKTLFRGTVVCPSRLSLADASVLWAVLTDYGARCERVLTSNTTHLVVGRKRSKKSEAARKLANCKVVTPDWVTECVRLGILLDTADFDPDNLTAESGYSTPDATALIQECTQATVCSAASQPSATSHQVPVPLTLPQHMFDTTTSAAGFRQQTPQALPQQQQLAFPTQQFVPQQQYYQQPMLMNAEQQGVMMQPGHVVMTPRGPCFVRPQFGASPTNGVRFLPPPTAAQSPRTTPGSPRGPADMEHYIKSVAQTVVAEPEVELANLVTHDPADAVPSELFFTACVFYMGAYVDLMPEARLSQWLRAIEEAGGECEVDHNSRVTHTLVPDHFSPMFELAVKEKKRVATLEWLRDCLAARAQRPPWKPIHLPLPYAASSKLGLPLTDFHVAMTGFSGAERIEVRFMLRQMGASVTSYMADSFSLLIVKRVNSQKYNAAMDWSVPVANFTWVKDMWLGYLAEALRVPLAPRYHTFQSSPGMQELCQQDLRVGRVSMMLAAWRHHIRASKEAIRRALGQRQRKRPPPVIDTQDADNLTTLSLSQQQLSSACVLITGYNTARADQLKRRVRSLGGLLTERPEDCTHLVSPAIVRTVRFLLSLNHCSYVLSDTWLDASWRADRFLPETAFWLRDPTTEGKYRFSLVISVERAKKRKLFRDITFFLTPGIQPKQPLVKQLIESAGGLVLHLMPSRDRLAASDVLIITNSADLALFPSLSGSSCRCYSPELVIVSILKQELDTDSYLLSVKEECS